MKPNLLIVDDDEGIRTQMRWALSADYEVQVASDRPSAVELYSSVRPDAVLLDLGLPPSPATPDEGLAALSEILAINSAAKVIVVTGQGEKEVALRAVGAGAYDFLGKPVDMDELKVTLRRSYQFAALEREYQRMQQQVQQDGFDGMLGSHPLMTAVFESIRKVATTDAPVLILGESGTGKEMVAQSIHRKSVRRDMPFIAINCSAIPETLIESELFGHEKGSFTGAYAQRRGRIEMAEGGTLFLDEIGEVPLPVQVKLLRFLQEQRIERIGGRQEIQVNARIIAATNADMKKALSAGTFREDLYYRLAVVKITLPRLAARNEDVVVLARAFLARFSETQKKQGLAFSPEAVRAMRQYPWPGNVRELQNRVNRAVIMCNGKRISAHDLELVDSTEPQPGLSLKKAREALEREMVTAALQRHSGNITAASGELGVSRPTFYELMVKLEIAKPE
ncbi:MAG TPA: PEP-CTERM-box response regulator transcription factor [Opitutaceae bacterium]|jgi:two-component system NtrC family response regulator